ncbi:right-handed parallel beta-helix repeat-containing protein [Schlesneria sp. T3-172]|uniref:right-handed parallel beta-helix repeat-containing protein n=1 Tax=Schlesneria sphaerica TaxID=3373610 RepID=UPI0037CAB387
MQRVNIGFVCLSWLVLASAVSAQTAVDTYSDSGVAEVQNFSGGGVLQGTYFDIRHMTGDGVGYRDSYSQIGVFTPIWVNEDAFIAPNARLIITNSSQIGVNAGLVGRKYVDSLDRIFGVYGYYDDDENYLNNRYSQFNVGAETLGEWWDLRGNGYFVNGSNDNFVAPLGISGNPYFVGNSLAFNGLQLRDQSMSGGDMEFGVPVSASAQWLRAYSGFYAYRTSEQNTFGYRGRVEAMISNDLTVGLVINQDRLWGTNLNATVDFRFSGFQPTRYFPNLSVRERMLNPVQRNWRVATHTYNQQVDIAAINPETNKPYFITHVNNSNTSGGDGTFQNPFKNLPGNAPGDIILVHNGNSSEANPVTGSIILSDNQRLLGTGRLSTVDLYARYGNTIYGNFDLPGTSNSGIYPYMRNDNASLNGGSVVTLANNNEVRALNFTNSAGDAIRNTSAGSRNFLLHNLEISGNGGRGIALTNASGGGVIRDINVGTANHANPFGYGRNAGGGIQIDTAVPGLDLFMSNVQMNADASQPQPFGVKLNADDSYLNVMMKNVFTNGNGTGIQLSETSQQLTAYMDNVRSNNNSNAGIQIDGTGGSITVFGTNVAAMQNGSNNLQIGTQAAPIKTSTVGVTFSESNFSNSVGGSGIVFSQLGGAGTLNLTNVNAIGNAVDGLGIYATNNTLMNANVRDSQFQNNVRDAFHVEGTLGSTVNLFVDPTDASGSGRDALHYRLNDSRLNVAFLENNLNNSGRSAVHGELSQNSVVNLFFDYNTARNSGGDGFYLNATGNSFANLEFSHGTLANSGRLVNGSSAFNIISDNSTINLLSNLSPANNIAPNGSVSNQAYGLKLDLKNASLFNGNIYNGDFSDTLVNAVRIDATTGSDAALTLLNTSGSRSGSDGFVANVDYSRVMTDFTNSDFNNSGRDGMNFKVSNGGILNSRFNNSSLSNSERSGIYGDVSGAASVASISMLNGSNINNSGANGVEYIMNDGEFNFASRSSSISNNGQNGAGSGVLGVINNGAVNRLDFANATINNNADNGIFVTSRNDSIVQASVNLGSVDNNGTSLMSLRGNDGIRLDIERSPFSFLQVYNGASVSGNGNDGISIRADQGTNFVGAIGTDIYGRAGQGVRIVNNGVALPPFVNSRTGLEVVATSNSQVGLSLNSVTLGNTFPFGSQQIGMNLFASGNSHIDASVVSSNLSNNAANAVNTTVTGPSSEINLAMANVQADRSGSIGGLFNALNGGSLNVYTSANTSFSQSGGAGMFVRADGANSVANFNLVSTSLDANGTFFGGQGFFGVASNGGNLNTAMVTSSVSSNANQGIQLTTNNPGSLTRMNVVGSTVDFNGSEGLLINVGDEGEVQYRSIGNSYNGNGNNGGLDGVNVTAVGNGASDSAKALLLFYGDTMDFNAGDGISLTALDGATLTTSIEAGTSASSNGRYGIQVDASGTNTKFNLLMTGLNTFEGNVLGPIAGLDFSFMDQAVVSLTGSYDTTGVQATYTNVNNGLFALSGPGTVNSATGDGVNVQMTNVTNGSVLINGVSSINDSVGDGIQIGMNNVANGAINLFGPTEIARSGGRGIDISLTDTTLVSNLGLNVALAPVEVLTVTDNLSSPLNNQLPVPVVKELLSLGTVANTALIVQGQTVTNSGAEGIAVTLNNSLIEAGETYFSQNSVSQSTGDGILITVNNSIADGIKIVGTSSNSNTGNGLNIVGNGASLRDLTISSGGTGVNTGLDFTITGNTFPAGGGTFNLINTSGTSTADVTGFTLDTSTSVSGAIFNTQGGANYPFTPYNGTDVTTGLATVNGTVVPVPGADPYPPTLVDDFSQLLELTFTSFAPGENFQWDNDFDLTPGGDETVYGSDLIGSTIQVDYTGGLTLGGTLVALPGNPEGSHFVATTGNIGQSSFSSNGADGIQFNLNNTDLSNLTVAGAVIQSNGTSQVGHGIEFTGNGGTVTNSTLDNITLVGNTVSLNTGDGVRLVNAQTVNSTINMIINENSISQNTGSGLNMTLVNGGQDLRASIARNMITENGLNAANPALNAAGINVVLGDNANYTGGFDSNTISGNGTQGVNLQMGLNGQITSNFTNNVINGNLAEGINLALKNGGHFEGAQFYGNQIGTAAERNGGMGVKLVVPDQASFNWNLGDTTRAGNEITGNTDAGVGILMTGGSTGVLNVANSTFSNTVNGPDQNFNGDGLRTFQQGASSLTGTMVQSTFTNNVGNGAQMTVTGNNLGVFASLNNFVVGGATADLGNTFTNNGANGLEFSRTADGQINNMTIQHNQFLTNSGNGLAVLAANEFRTDTYTINDNRFVANSLNGILFDERADANIRADIARNTITNNGANGIQLIEQVNNASDLRGTTGTWTQNLIANNAGDGIALNGRTVGLVISNSQITLNQQNGIEVTGAGSLTIDQNEITYNGTLANLNTAALNAGIKMDVAPTSSIVVTNNLVDNNFGDAIQYQISAGYSGFTSNVAIVNNEVTNNHGRGINMINRGYNTTNATISNNYVAANRLEGVYIVNTASTTQAIWASSTTPLVADGSVFSSPNLNLVMDGNTVIGNGLNSDLTGTGLVIRIGTSDGGYGSTFAGGFASQGYGGVVARIDNNFLGGNFGDDVLFHSFVSTVTPVTSAGTWSPTEFQLDAYQSDPLSRFDLTYRNNTTDPGSFDQFGTSLGGFASRNQALVAFYNNAEGVFKSRQFDADPAGPFVGAERARNATRLAARIPFYNAPIGSADFFLYPGMGQSVWRASADSDPVFVRDGFPYTNTGDANGFFLNGVGNNGELPYGWGTF